MGRGAGRLELQLVVFGGVRSVWHILSHCMGGQWVQADYAQQKSAVWELQQLFWATSSVACFSTSCALPEYAQYERAGAAPAWAAGYGSGATGAVGEPREQFCASACTTSHALIRSRALRRDDREQHGVPIVFPERTGGGTYCARVRTDLLMRP